MSTPRTFSGVWLPRARERGTHTLRIKAYESEASTPACASAVPHWQEERPEGDARWSRALAAAAVPRAREWSLGGRPRGRGSNFMANLFDLVISGASTPAREPGD